MNQVSAAKYARPFWRWYAAILLMLLYTCSTLDRNVAYVVIQPVKAEFHLSDGQVGLMSGFLFGIANGIAGLFLSPLVDRLNRRNFLAGLVVVWSLATCGAGLAGSFVMLLLSRGAVGAAESASVPASLSMLSSIFPESRRSTATGVFFLSTVLGAFVASAGGGLLAAHWGWRAAFFAAGAPGLVLCLVMMLTMPEPRRTAGPPRVRGELMGALLHTLRNRTVAPHFLGIVLFALVLGGRSSFLIAFFMRYHGLAIQQAGPLIGIIAAVGGLVGTLSGGLVADLLGRRGAHVPQWWLALVGGLTGVTDLAMVFAPTLQLALAAAALSALIGTMWLGPGYGVLVGLTPEHMRGKMLALLQVGANIATGIGALVVGMLSDAYGGPDALRWAMATLCLTFFIIGGLFALAAVSHPSKTVAGAADRDGTGESQTGVAGV